MVIFGSYNSINNQPYIGLSRVSIQAVLPLTLANLTAKAITQGNQVNWEVSTKVNVKTITLERSGANNNFSPLAILPATATQFIDNNPLNGDNYYRLSSTDNDGTTNTYNKIALVKGFLEVATIYPNPVSNGVLNIIAGSQAIQSVTLINLSGVKVLNIPKVKTPKAVVINTQGLIKGVYLLEINAENSTTVKKVMVN